MKYVKSAAILFIAPTLLFNLLIVLYPFLIWDMTNVLGFYGSDMFYLVIRSILLVSLCLPLFNEYKIIKV